MRLYLTKYFLNFKLIKYLFEYFYFNANNISIAEIVVLKHIRLHCIIITENYYTYLHTYSIAPLLILIILLYYVHMLVFQIYLTKYSINVVLFIIFNFLSNKFYNTQI